MSPKLVYGISEESTRRQILRMQIDDGCRQETGIRCPFYRDSNYRDSNYCPHCLHPDSTGGLFTSCPLKTRALVMYRKEYVL